MDFIEEKRVNNVDQEEGEVRLIDIVQFVKNSYRKILLGALTGLVLGMFYIIPKPNMYTVEVTIMPEIQGRGTSAFGILAAGSMGGISDNTGALDNRPDLYPEVLGSIPFAMHMLKQAVYSRNLGATMTLEQFINRSSTADIFTKIKGLFTIDDDNSKSTKSGPKNISQAIEVTKGQYGLIKAVQGSVTSSFDKKTGVITVTATESDPVVAATVAHLSLDYLTRYIINYRTDKAHRRVQFLNQQVKEAKQRYERAQYALSSYRDRNISVYLNTAKIEEQRLQSDYLLEQSVYNDLARQLELAKVKVEEDTPTVKVLEPPVVPINKSGPKRTVIIIGFGVAGALIMLGILFIRSRKLFA